MMQRGTSQPVPLKVSIPCVPGCEQARVTDPQSYQAQMTGQCPRDVLVTWICLSSLGYQPPCSAAALLPSPLLPPYPAALRPPLLLPPNPAALCPSCFIHSQHPTPDAMLHPSHLVLPTHSATVSSCGCCQRLPWMKCPWWPFLLRFAEGLSSFLGHPLQNRRQAASCSTLSANIIVHRQTQPEKFTKLRQDD